ncbi:MAG: 30S ribosomal protein S6 [Saprospiraceae bacterium]
MNQYEVTFIVDSVLSGDEIKTTAKTYEDLFKDGGATIVNVDALGLQQLAYPIKKRTSGIYYVVEFKSENGSIIPKVELAFRRDERILRFLTVRLDKHGVKYNEDKRNGLIGSKKAKVVEEVAKEVKTEAKKPVAKPATPKSSTPVAPAASEEE